MNPKYVTTATGQIKPNRIENGHLAPIPLSVDVEVEV